VAGQKKTREKIMEEALKSGAPPPPVVEQRGMPPIDLHGATVVDELDLDDVCNTLIDGYSLRDIASELDRNYVRKHGKMRTYAGHPARTHATTLLRWVEKDAERIRRYEQAKEAQADALFSEMLQVANEAVPLTIFGSMDSAAVQNKRVRLDTLRWITSKLKPKAYGEKLDLTSGGDKIPPMSPAQADARLVALLEKARPGLNALPAPEGEQDE
jgi:hypothetical protein